MFDNACNNTNNNKSVVNEINEHFKLPIYYNDKKMKIKQHIVTDLELIQTVDASGCKPIYNYFFNNDNTISEKLIEQVSEYYTTDIDFINQNQDFLKGYKRLDKKYTTYSPNYKNIVELWNEIKCETDFKGKYYYIDWSALEFLNKSEHFLQFMSLYNLASPILSLLTPIFILIVPFFIIKMKGHELTVSEYIEVLKVLAESHAIGKLFTQFNDVTVNEKIYLLISAAFYIFSIYQNIHVFIKFHANMVKIHNHFNEISKYLDYTIKTMDNYLVYASEYPTQNDFCKALREKKQKLEELRRKISTITEYKLTSYKKIQEIGYVLKYFYELYDETVYNETIAYSLGFNGYVDCLEGLQNNIEERKINYSSFVKSKGKSQFKNSYYGPLKDENPIKNTVKFKKNIILTGPNASGKTTILKSTLINIILTQQFGCGFYDYAQLNPFKYIHCYLNIPDTSGRDSLFQAEARRCKDILDIVKTNEDETHFCGFDELYSGTNPDEAVTSSTAFLNYLIKNQNVSCILTTHFIKVCKKLGKNKSILNCHMETEKKENKLVYKYKLVDGISEVKGGIAVLTAMDYPAEIISNTNI
jgi:energy-coupling factor transporter ATP-binding protein EcfA2